MMLREIIMSASPTITVLVPQEMIGKKVEIIAFEIPDEVDELTSSQRLENIKALTKSSMVDLSKFTFNRDDANDYDR